jgi:hypothetical protein
MVDDSSQWVEQHPFEDFGARRDWLREIGAVGLKTTVDAT